MDLAPILLTVGTLFLAGLVADQIGRHYRVPRITALLAIGLLMGDAGFGLIPADVTAWFDIFSIMALTMVAFLLGGSLSRRSLATHGRAILSISLSIVILTLAVVALGLAALGLDPALALVLGAIATATAPAAMADVIRQSGVSNGFTDTLKGVVAIDDAWGLIAFSLVVVLAAQGNGTDLIAGLAKDLGGSLILGLAIGLPAAYLTGRLSPGEPLQTEALGIVFLTAGFAILFDLSFLIAGMTAGAVVVNFARHHDRAFHEIEHIQWPFMVLFFLLAGATLDWQALASIGPLGAAYLALRIVSRLAGGWVGARLGRAPAEEVRWFGPALLPQAGVAVGMALVASEAFPSWSADIMALTIATTVVFELIGPPVTMLAIRRTAQ